MHADMQPRRHAAVSRPALSTPMPHCGLRPASLSALSAPPSPRTHLEPGDPRGGHRHAQLPRQLHAEQVLGGGGEEHRARVHAALQAGGSGIVLTKSGCCSVWEG